MTLNKDKKIYLLNQNSLSCLFFSFLFWQKYFLTRSFITHFFTPFSTRIKGLKYSVLHRRKVKLPERQLFYFVFYESIFVLYCFKKYEISETPPPITLDFCLTRG